MFKYVIINPDWCEYSPISKALKYTDAAIVGTVLAKSRTKALEYAKTLPNSGDNPIVPSFKSLTKKEREYAEKAPLLWTQPESNPITHTNPRGAGRVKTTDESMSVSLRLRLSATAAERYRASENKSLLTSELIERWASESVTRSEETDSEHPALSCFS
jgi:hypothetical protein